MIGTVYRRAMSSARSLVLHVRRHRRAARRRTRKRRTIRPSSPRPTEPMPTGRPTRRQPAKMLAFTGVKAGMKVLDMEAGAGYSTELLARAVGPTGVVYAQDSAAVIERFVKDKFDIRAQKPAMKNVVHVIRDFDDPIPPECRQPRPDHLLLRLSRHHLHAGRSRRDEPEDVRGAEARRLPDHRRSFRQARRRHQRGQDAAPDRGERAARRRSRRPVSSSSAEGDFLRHPEDPRDAAVFRPQVPVDEFVLKYQKPL